MCQNLEGASFHHRYFGPKLIFWLSNVAAIREPPKVESSLALQSTTIFSTFRYLQVADKLRATVYVRVNLVKLF